MLHDEDTVTAAGVLMRGHESKKHGHRRRRRRRRRRRHHLACGIRWISKNMTLCS